MVQGETWRYYNYRLCTAWRLPHEPLDPFLAFAEEADAMPMVQAIAHLDR